MDNFTSGLIGFALGSSNNNSNKSLEARYNEKATLIVKTKYKELWKKVRNIRIYTAFLLLIPILGTIPAICILLGHEDIIELKRLIKEEKEKLIKKELLDNKGGKE